MKVESNTLGFEWTDLVSSLASAGAKVYSAKQQTSAQVALARAQMEAQARIEQQRAALLASQSAMPTTPRIGFDERGQPVFLPAGYTAAPSSGLPQWLLPAVIIIGSILFLIVGARK